MNNIIYVLIYFKIITGVNPIYNNLITMIQWLSNKLIYYVGTQSTKNKLLLFNNSWLHIAM